MFSNAKDLEDLRSEIRELKKLNASIVQDNNLLKVKIRKLQEDISKKDRQIDALIDPRKSSNFRKLISEKGAHLLINLKDKNAQMEKNIQEKDILIKRLQNQLLTARLYKDAYKQRMPLVPNQMPVEESQVIEDKDESPRTSLEESHFEKPDNSGRPSPRSPPRTVNDFSVMSTTVINEVKELKKNLMKNELFDPRKNVNLPNKRQEVIDRLVSIMDLYGSEGKSTGRKSKSPDSDLDRAELYCGTPHEEIQQLQRYFLNILNEIDNLKFIILKLQGEQKKTNVALQEKEGTINVLAEEIMTLKQYKSPRVPPNSLVNTSRSHKKYRSISASAAKQQRQRSKADSVETKSNSSKRSKRSIESKKELECPYYRNYIQAKQERSASTKKGHRKILEKGKQKTINQVWARNDAGDVENGPYTNKMKKKRGDNTDSDNDKGTESTFAKGTDTNCSEVSASSIQIR